jgi:putative membrane protein
MWQMHNVGAGWWILGTLGMIAFSGLIIWALVAAARGTPAGRRDDDDAVQKAPEAIVKRRLARGEITPEEYQRLRDTLSDDTPRPDPAALSR